MQNSQIPFTLSDRAAERVKFLMSQHEKPALGLRISVNTKGCAGLAYSMAIADQKEPFDELVESKGVTLLLDSKAVMFLIGSELDFVEDQMQARFVFNNPNEKGRCGCGESFYTE
jgi:iron-sulfur cluster assembly protein